MDCILGHIPLYVYIGRSIILCPYFGGSTIGRSTILCSTHTV